MDVITTLNNVLALLEKTLVPGSESEKMTAAKADLRAVVRAIRAEMAQQQAQAQQDAAKEEENNETGNKQRQEL